MYQLSHSSLFSTCKTAFTCLITKSLKPIITCSREFYNQVGFFSLFQNKKMLHYSESGGVSSGYCVEEDMLLHVKETWAVQISFPVEEPAENQSIKCSSLFTYLSECWSRGHHRASTLTILPPRNAILKANDSFLGVFPSLTDLEGNKKSQESQPC